MKMYRSIFRTEMELRSVQQLVRQQMKEQDMLVSMTKGKTSQEHGSEKLSVDRVSRFVDTRSMSHAHSDNGYSTADEDDELSEISAAAAAEGLVHPPSEMIRAMLIEDVKQRLELVSEKLAAERCTLVATPPTSARGGKDGKTHSKKDTKARITWQAASRSRSSSGATTANNSTSTSSRAFGSSAVTSVHDSPIRGSSSHGETVPSSPGGRTLSSRKMFATLPGMATPPPPPPPAFQCTPRGHASVSDPVAASPLRVTRNRVDLTAHASSTSYCASPTLTGTTSEDVLVSPREQVRLASKVASAKVSSTQICVKPTPIVVTRPLPRSIADSTKHTGSVTSLNGLFDGTRSPGGTERSSTSSFSSASSAFSSAFVSPSKQQQQQQQQKQST